MDSEIILNLCVFAAIFLISCVSRSDSFPHSLDTSDIFPKVSHSNEMTKQPDEVTETTGSVDERDDLAALQRQTREIQNIYGLQTSNDITHFDLPRGVYNPSEDDRGFIVNSEHQSSENSFETRNTLDAEPINDGLDHGNVMFSDGDRTHSNLERGPYNYAEVGEGHGQVIYSEPEVENLNYDDDSLSVIPLQKP